MTLRLEVIAELLEQRFNCPIQVLHDGDVYIAVAFKPKIEEDKAKKVVTFGVGPVVDKKSTTGAIDALSNLNTAYIHHYGTAMDSYLLAGFHLEIEPTIPELQGRRMNLIAPNQLHAECVTPTLVEGLQLLNRFCQAHEPQQVAADLESYSRQPYTPPRIINATKPYLDVEKFLQ